MTAEERKQRLGRLDRIFPRFPIYFVTACTARRRRLLANKAIHDAFLQFAKSGPDHGAWVGAYILMPDHVHLFVATDDERLLLSGWMRSFKNAMSKTLRRRKVPPPHCQKTFFNHVLRSSESYSEKWNYVRENAVRAGLVNIADEWPFQGEVFRLDFGPE